MIAEMSARGLFLGLLALLIKNVGHESGTRADKSRYGPSSYLTKMGRRQRFHSGDSLKFI